MEPGIYKDMSIGDYHENRLVISSTGLKRAKKSTRDFIHYVLHGTERKSQFDFGNAFELAIMDAVNGTGLFEEMVGVRNTQKWLSKALKEKPELKSPKASTIYKKLLAEFETDNQGKYLIDDTGDSESKSALVQMVDSCISDPIVMRLLSGTEYQVTTVWKDEHTGLLCKSRPDICKTKKNVIVDIKTTLDASPEGFAREAAKYDYYLQAAMQIEGAIKTGLMEQVDTFYWLAVEKTPPYNYCLYDFGTEDIKYVMDSYEFYLQRCANAIPEIEKLQDGDLSGCKSYGESSDNKYGIVTLQMPVWYK